MAYMGSSKTSTFQTATNAGAVVAASLLKGGESTDAALALFREVRDAIFADLEEIRDTDTSASAPASGGGSYSGGGQRWTPPPPYTGEPAAYVLPDNFKQYAGQTVQQVFDSGEKGQGYLQWIAEKSKNKQAPPVVKAFLAAQGQ